MSKYGTDAILNYTVINSKNMNYNWEKVALFLRIRWCDFYLKIQNH